MAYAQVTAILRGLQVLESANRLGPATLSEIRTATALPKASTLRALDTLRHGGYVTFAPDTRRYLVAARALALSSNYQADKALLGRPPDHAIAA